MRNGAERVRVNAGGAAVALLIMVGWLVVSISPPTVLWFVALWLATKAKKMILNERRDDNPARLARF